MVEVRTTPAFVIEMLDSYKQYLSVQEYKTMRGQIGSGAHEAALKGLKRLLRRRGIISEHNNL